MDANHHQYDVEVARKAAEAVWRSTLYMKDAFREQWAEIQKHWFEFLYATATLVALETAALIASATPGTQLLGIVIQGLIIAFVAYAAVAIGIEAGQLTEGFWHSVKEANGDASKIDVAAEKFARLVIYILRLLAEAVAGGVLAKLSLNGMKRILGDQPVTPRLPATKGDELTSGPTSKPDEPASKTRDSLTSSKTKEATEPGRKKAEENRKPTSNVPAKVSNTSKPARSGTPDLPEYPVRLSDLKLEIKRSQFEWVIDIEAPLPNRGRVNIGIGSVELENGVPKGGPDFVIKKDAIVGGVLGKVQVYGPAGKLSLTDLVLDKTIEAFTKEFGHSPDRHPGSLAWDNKKNFQVEYARATRSGTRPRGAADRPSTRRAR